MADVTVEGFPIEGYACLFNVADLGRDLVLPGAFAASLARQSARGVRMLYQHDPAEPLGVWTDAFEDGIGLYVRGRLSPGVARARECAALVRDGAIDGLSIGFKAVEARTDPRTRLRRLSRIDLWEVSVVTFPMQPQARIARRSDELRIARRSDDPRIAATPSPALALDAAAARLRAAVGA
ncbi:HK97 family phage prohead protease [Xanthobacter dioxanivorans]|uniref:HK97 family phage prohead protease n=1 Tax=Xanthobacter dioxanivorans TaxID=2528964 RepID=A0A974SG14_9HYPH|nr:HK97 family phage prohead protease [Xanthobacter dioxanivorans]QRG04826.1 HK97 family phage prohead protease [Xanthobacter dioxanivorans]